MNTDAEKELQTILDSISDGFLVLDNAWNILWSNAAFEEISGTYKVRSLYGNFRNLTQSIEGLDIGHHIKAAQSSRSREEFEIYLPLRKAFYSVVIYASETNLILSFHNVTAQKKHGENVYLDEQNLRILVDIIVQPVWLVDAGCNILLSNEAFKTWISYFIGKPLMKGDNVLDSDLPRSYIDKFKMCYELALNGKTFTTVEDMMVNGELKFSTISFNPVYDHDNKLTGISCHASDITDQRKNLSRLDAQTQLLMEIANIQSHKVRGPVATLLGLVQIFDYEDPTNPDNAELVRGIASVTNSLDVIVRDVIRQINKLNKHTRAFR